MVFKMLSISAILSFLSLSSMAEIGIVKPEKWGANFKSEDIASAVFCVKKSRQNKNNGHCATAFLISKTGLVLTAHHVEDLPSGHGSRKEEQKNFRATQVLVDQNNQEYRYEIVNYPSWADANKVFMPNARELMTQEFIASRTGSFVQRSIVNHIADEHYDRIDTILLKIVDEDLAKLKAKPLKIRKTALKKGERLFVAGYPWKHYPAPFFESISNDIMAKTKNYPKPVSHNGDFSFMTGRFSYYKGHTVVTQANEMQEVAKDWNTDAIDTAPGASGGAVLDINGHVVAVHHASDSGLGRMGAIKRSLITFATDIRKVQELFQISP